MSVLTSLRAEVTVTYKLRLPGVGGVPIQRESAKQSRAVNFDRRKPMWIAALCDAMTQMTLILV